MRNTDIPESKRQLISRLQKSSKYLYFDIWDGSEEDKFDGLKKVIFSSDREIGIAAKLGQRFVDFRNLSLQCAEKSGHIVNPWTYGEIGGKRSIVADPNIWQYESKRKTVIGHSFKDDDLEWVDTIHPILLSTDKEKANTLASGQLEYTFTKFCNQRCIYGSGFGPQIEGTRTHGYPLTYILLFGFGEHRETGRMVNRLNTLGTLRMGAIHNLQRIKHECDYRLNDIENDLEEIQKLISEAFQDAFAGLGTRKKIVALWRRRKSDLIASTIEKALQVIETSHENNEKAWQQFRDRYKTLWLHWSRAFWLKSKETWRLVMTGRAEPGGWKQFHDKSKRIGELLTDVHNELGYLNVEGEKPHRVKRSLGWIPTRAWRSKYYRDRFDRLSRALNSKAIKGYQPYDIFLEHRLARAYSVIDLVAHHFGELQEKEIRLRKEWMALKADQRQREIASGQNVVEVFFFLVLLPYYGHYLVVALYEKFKGSLHLEDFFVRHHLRALHALLHNGRALFSYLESQNIFDDKAAIRVCFFGSFLILLVCRFATIWLFGKDVLHAIINTVRVIHRACNEGFDLLVKFWRWLAKKIRTYWRRHSTSRA